VAGLGRERPALAWPMTFAMLGLAGIPATAGFVGKFYLIDAAVAGAYTWLGVVIVVGSMISLGYYLPVIAAMWMHGAPAGAPRTGAPPPPTGELPALAGGSPELDRGSEAEPAPAGATGSGVPEPAVPGRQPEVTLVALLSAAATVVFGIFPEPLFNLVSHAGSALGLL
jgi:NADH-quinone oxidoreductase subunit N